MKSKKPITYDQFMEASTRCIANGIIKEGFDSLEGSVWKVIQLHNQYLEENKEVKK